MRWPPLAQTADGGAGRGQAEAHNARGPQAEAHGALAANPAWVLRIPLDAEALSNAGCRAAPRCPYWVWSSCKYGGAKPCVWMLLLPIEPAAARWQQRPLPSRHLLPAQSMAKRWQAANPRRGFLGVQSAGTNPLAARAGAVVDAQQGQMGRRPKMPKACLGTAQARRSRCQRGQNCCYQTGVCQRVVSPGARPRQQACWGTWANGPRNGRQRRWRRGRKILNQPMGQKYRGIGGPAERGGTGRRLTKQAVKPAPPVKCPKQPGPRTAHKRNLRVGCKVISSAAKW